MEVRFKEFNASLPSATTFGTTSGLTLCFASTYARELLWARAKSTLCNFYPLVFSVCLHQWQYGVVDSKRWPREAITPTLAQTTNWATSIGMNKQESKTQDTPLQRNREETKKVGSRDTSITDTLFGTGSLSLRLDAAKRARKQCRHSETVMLPVHFFLYESARKAKGSGSLVSLGSCASQVHQPELHICIYTGFTFSFSE